MSFRLALLSIYFISVELLCTKAYLPLSLHLWLVPLVTLLILNIREMPSIYFKLLQTYNPWFELKMYTPSFWTSFPAIRMLEKRHISKVSYSLIKLALVNFDFNQLTFTTALQGTLIYWIEKSKMADFLSSLIFLASVISSNFNIFHV